MTWNETQVAPTLAAIDAFLKAHPDADAERIYCGGYSMGGGMTWLVLRARPDFFAAAVPCCPAQYYLPNADEFSKFDDTPIWSLLGEEDTYITRAVLEIMPEILERARLAGTDTRVTVLPHEFLFPDGETRTPVDHLVWIPALNNLRYDDGTPYADRDGVVLPPLIEWLNAQRRK
jgi:predicted peptidase